MAVIAGEERPEGRPPPTDGPPLLLLADEELIHHESLSQQLEQRGFRVTRARSGPRALMVA
ncbi:MAG TPA: hypothetical protein DEP84_25780, partial [Chloroflexi bacterium]|nr:hypothetical protein [Chloroflexota bacterium]